jgi:diphosphomevalonate decarboxylase
MGKEDTGDLNQSTNSSLSYSLESLRTFVQLTVIDSSFVHEAVNHDSVTVADQWKNLEGEGLFQTELSQKGKDKFLKHLKFLKQEFGVKENFLIESANNFPADCGLASSASSFAALTDAAFAAFRALGYEKANKVDVQMMAQYSQKGSGSSCRSFFGPWALWHKEGVRAIELPMGALRHMVVVVDDQRKDVSSSEAHLRVKTSSLFVNRVARAEERLANLLEALKSQDWQKSFEITWAEFWDMHALFETSYPSFGYMTADSLKVLQAGKTFWKQQGDGPLITMDAGPNVHFLFREDQKNIQEKLYQELSKTYKVFSS